MYSIPAILSAIFIIVVGLLMVISQASSLFVPSGAGVFYDISVGVAVLGLAIAIYGLVVLVRYPNSIKTLVWSMGLLSLLSAAFIYALFWMSRLAPSDSVWSTGEVLLFLPPVICMLLFAWVQPSYSTKNSDSTLRNAKIRTNLVVAVVSIILIYTISQYGYM